MPNVAVSTNFGSLPTYTYPSGYDPTKLGLGPLMTQANDAGSEGKWVGPMPINVARPMETIAAVPCVVPYSVSWSSTYDWVFFMDNGSATATRRVVLYTFNKTVRTNAWTFIGYITLNFPFSGTQGSYNPRGHAVSYEKYTTGTVAINNGSTSLTGSGTTWSTDRMFVGSRIGFGTTDPTQVSTWYEIAAINSDTSITLTSSFQQTNISNSAYVIEDLRVISVFINGTTFSNGGTFMAAGLKYDLFLPGGTTIPAATTVDKARAVYWLSDGTSTSNSVIQSLMGIALDTKVNWTSQFIYVFEGPSNLSRFQVSNIRAPMTLTLGRDAITGNTWQFNTALVSMVGVYAGINSVVLCTPQHGPRAGQKQLFWVTNVRIYCTPVSLLSANSSFFQAGCAIENPPGSSTSYASTGTVATIAYDSLSDRFLILTASSRGYFTQYREDGGQWDRIVFIDNKQLNQSTADPTITPLPNTLSAIGNTCFSNGMCYYAVPGIAAVTNFIYSFPIGADWETASTTNCRVVLPAMSLSGFTSLISGYMNVIEVLGGKTGTNLGIEPGAVRMYYRTTGITNNTGVWTLLDYSGDMSSVGIGYTKQIQAMLEFRTATTTGIPGRVTRVGFEGAGISPDVHFQWSQNLSNLSSKQFVWRYSTDFGGTVPTLYIRIYDGVTGSLLVSDNSVSQIGTWEKCTNGSTFGSFNTSDRTNETTYVRFTPYSMSDNVNALAIISLS